MTNECATVDLAMVPIFVLERWENVDNTCKISQMEMDGDGDNVIFKGDEVVGPVLVLVSVMSFKTGN